VTSSPFDERDLDSKISDNLARTVPQFFVYI
jgi:hypothetical protein